MIQSRPNVIQAPQQHNGSPFLNFIQGVSKALTPFVPEAGLVGMAAGALNGKTSPFDLAKGIAGQVSGGATDEGADVLKKAVPDDPTQGQSPLGEGGSSQSSGSGQSQGAGPGGVGEGPVGQGASDQYLPHIEQLYQQFPNEFHSILSDPNLVDGGTNFMNALAAFKKKLAAQSQMSPQQAPQ